MKKGNTMTHRLPAKNRAAMAGQTARSVASSPACSACWAGMWKGESGRCEPPGEDPAPQQRWISETSGENKVVREPLQRGACFSPALSAQLLSALCARLLHGMIPGRI